MQLTIDPTIFEIEPAFKIGINYYTKITVSESPQMFRGRMQLFQEQLFFELEDKPIGDYLILQEWRQLWKALGADPNRYRPSAEALFRRIKKQQYLQPFNSAVDLNNFFSLQYQIPVGIYDVDQLTSPLHIQIGHANTSYEGLNGRENKLQNLLTLFDATSAFGSPYVDSKRTAVSEATTTALQVFFLQPSLSASDAQKLLTACGTMFTQISGGDVQTNVLTNQLPNWEVFS